MRKLALIIFTVSLNLGLFSCTPQSITEGSDATYQDCCGDDEHTPPPPPPQT